MEQEQILRIQMIEQETNQLNEQLQMIEQTVAEMQQMNLSLDEIRDNKTDKIMVNLGRRIFVSVSIINKDFFVDVGKGHFIKKDIQETKRIVDDHAMQLITSKTIIMDQLQKLQNEIEEIIHEVEKERSYSNKKRSFEE